jgi:hypothetical protein
MIDFFYNCIIVAGGVLSLISLFAVAYVLRIIIKGRIEFYNYKRGKTWW